MKCKVGIVMSGGGCRDGSEIHAVALAPAPTGGAA